MCIIHSVLVCFLCRVVLRMQCCANCTGYTSWPFIHLLCQRPTGGQSVGANILQHARRSKNKQSTCRTPLSCLLSVIAAFRALLALCYALMHPAIVLDHLVSIVVPLLLIALMFLVILCMAVDIIGLPCVRHEPQPLMPSQQTLECTIPPQPQQ